MKHWASIILLLLLVGIVTVVSAHDAIITKSTPANGEILAAAPSEVMAWFTEELVSSESTMTVFSAEGEQVDNADGGVNLNDPDHASMIVTLPPLPDGSYTVQWHAALLDGDMSDGAFTFAVGEGQKIIPAAKPSPLATAAAATNTANEEEGGWASNGLLVAVIAGLLILLLIGSLSCAAENRNRH